jgi:DHA3 family tetracycline resistance protein-like MFS transporter
MRTLSADRFYLAGEGIRAFAQNLAWVIIPVYFVLTAHMTPFQLLLTGAAFELTIFLSNVPTGALADVWSRRLAVIIGSLLVGCALLLEGLVPVFWVILIAEVVDGLGDASVAGAWTAWLMDEVGAERFGGLLARGAQVRQIASLAGAVCGALLATLRLPLPVALAGGVSLAFGLLALAAMPERGFRPAPYPPGARVRAVTSTLRGGARAVRTSNLLLAILGLAVVFGAFTEGIDYLSEPHLLLDVGLPPLLGLKPVAWFGVVSGGGLLLGAAGLELPRRRVDMESHRAVAGALLAVTVGVILCALAFALSPSLALALGAYWVWGALRPSFELLSTVWLNQNVPHPELRATVLSMSGGANALGEWAGGPVLGLIATGFTIRAALTASALLLTPALAVYGWALGQSGAPKTAVSAEAHLPDH